MAFWGKKSGDQPSAPEAPATRAPAPAMPPMGGSATAPSMGHMNAPPAAPAAPAHTADPAAGGANAPAELSEEQRRKMASASKMIAAAFGEIVSLLMRTPNYKHMMLSDLEWFVVPAVASGQFTLAEAQSKASGITQPMGVVLWARVSPEIDQRLHQNLDQPIRMKPQEWTSGDIVWIIEAAGEARVIEALLKRMRETVWAGKTIRLRARDKDGKNAVGTVPAVAATAGAQA